MVAEHIGVRVDTSARSGPTNTGAPAGVLHVAGITQRGPVTEAVSVRNLGEYAQAFGERTSYASALFDTARTFFEEEGSELIVSRVVGEGSQAASADIQFTTEGSEEEPGETISMARFEATQPGAFANQWRVEITQPENADGALVHVYDRDELIAVFRDVVNVPDLVDKARSTSVVRVLDTGGANAEQSLPLGEFEFYGGDDDRANVTTERIIQALDEAKGQGQGGMVAVPGYTANLIGQELLDYAARSNKIAALAGHRDASIPEIIQLASTFSTSQEYGGLFYPHIVIPDGSSTRTISPEGYVAAARARAFRDTGIWQRAAGDASRARWIIGTHTPVSTEANLRLSAGRVNGIVTTGNRVRLYNWRSLTVQEEFKDLSSRDFLNNLSVQVSEALEPLLFETIDGRGYLLSRVEGAVEAILAPIARAGGVYARVVDGEEEDPGYSVAVNAANNPASLSAENSVRVDIGVRLSPTAADIHVEIVKVPLTESF
ncbi:hypothetical protein [Nesterenkonia rhizosphaerae]|uniref:Tail sheath protein subtilisin-like domain-containing protein n=1 Tax=Nesterenkonia rhizosphaerae TaxID=1348272 RepID=A0ABP9FUG5_9MICC